MFVRTTNGYLVPISRIAKLRKALPPDKVWYVDLVDGDTDAISDQEAERLKNLPVAYLPAVPGIRLLDASDISEEPLTEEVIGWAIEADGCPTAITPEGLMTGMTNPWVISFPSGYVTLPGMQSWDSVEQYLGHCRSAAQ